MGYTDRYDLAIAALNTILENVNDDNVTVIEKYGITHIGVIRAREIVIASKEVEAQNSTSNNTEMLKTPCVDCKIKTVVNALKIAGHNYCSNCGRQL